MKRTHTLSPQQLLMTYTIGFVLSLSLTVMAYTIVVNHDLFGTRHFVVGAVVCLALMQFLAQIVFFLHVGTEARTKWKLLAFMFMLGTVVILVAGSLWIMDNLNYNMQSDHQKVDEYLEKHDSL